MKKTIIRIIAATLLLVACGPAPVLADGAFPVRRSARREQFARKKCFPPMSGWFMLATHPPCKN